MLGGEDVGDEGQTAHDRMSKYSGHVGNESRARDPGQIPETQGKFATLVTLRKLTPQLAFQDFSRLATSLQDNWQPF